MARENATGDIEPFPLKNEVHQEMEPYDNELGADPAKIGQIIGDLGDELEEVNLSNPNEGGAIESHAPLPAKESAGRQMLAGLTEAPVVALAVALLVGSVPFLHGLFYGKGAPLSLLTSGLAVVGKASPAVTSAIAGGSFGLQLLKFRRDDPLGIRALGLSGKAMIGLVVGRIVLVPIFLIGLFCLVPSWFPRDRWMRLLLFFQPAGATANVVIVLAQLADQPQGAEMAALANIPQMILYIPVATLLITLGMKVNEDI